MNSFVSIGFGSTVNTSRIVAVISPDSAPVKRIISVARENEKLIDATYGRRTRSVVVMESDHVILCALQPETLGARLGVSSHANVQDEEDT